MKYTLYIQDGEGKATLDLAQRIAGIRGESVSSVFAQTLQAYVKKHKHLADAVDKAQKEGKKNA